MSRSFVLFVLLALLAFVACAHAESLAVEAESESEMGLDADVEFALAAALEAEAEAESDDEALLETEMEAETETELEAESEMEDEAMLELEMEASPYNRKLPNPDARKCGESGANRVFNPALGACLFTIDEGAKILANDGTIRGHVHFPDARREIMINYGQKKSIKVNRRGKATPCVYGFYVPMAGSVERVSGWIPLYHVKYEHRPILQKMKSVTAKKPPGKCTGKPRKVTGGNPKAFGALKVVRKSTSPNMAASDYLLRPGNMVNFLYALPGAGGVTTDTIRKNSASFKQCKQVKAVSVPLYKFNSTKVVGKMKFIYGVIDGRYGWIAEKALGK
jgi:hypothetical protein